MARNRGCCRRAKSALTSDCSPVRLPNWVEGYLPGQQGTCHLSGFPSAPLPQQGPRCACLGSVSAKQSCDCEFLFQTDMRPPIMGTPLYPGMPQVHGCLDKLSGKSGASRTWQLGKQAQGAGWRLALAPLRPHPEGHCVITETRHHTLRGLSDSARTAATSSWHWVEWGTTGRPGMTPVGC